MAVYYIPTIIPSTWNMMPRNQQSQGKDNWILLVIFLVIIVVIVTVVTVVHFFPGYIFRRRRRRRARVDNTLEVDSCQPVGMDATDMTSLPTFTHGSNGGNDGGEGQCTVCLSAPKKGEVMKLLPNCKHFFHVKCIDMWLHSHSTCPMCRADAKQRGGRGGGGQLLGSPTMPARGGGVRREELSMFKVMVKSFSNIRMSIGRRQGQVDNVVVDLERQ